MNIWTEFKSWVHQSLSRIGIHIYSDRSLPYGIDLKRDIARCGRRKIECVFDVGANVGQSVARFNSYWPAAKIFCFEPVEQTFRELIENTRGLLNIRCENMALGASRGTGTIWLKQANLQNSLKADVNQQQISIGQSEKVNIVTLDDFCLENQVDHIDFLKLDVEGYELEVLKGAEQMLASHAIQFIYTETTFHPSDSQHTLITRLSDYLEPLSYRCLGIYDGRLRFNAIGEPTCLRSCDALFIQQSQTKFGEAELFE